MARERLSRDVAALAARPRASASADERATAGWIAGRLRELGIDDVRVVPYRGQARYAPAHLVHLGLGFARPRLLALLGLALLEGELSGRLPLVRRLLPRAEGTNVVARVPARGEPERLLVLVAHHDTARTGWMWSPRLARPQAARRLRRRSMDPFGVPFALGLALAASPARRLGLLLLGAVALAELDVARSAPVPGANDNATGVAAVLALLEAGPRPGTEVRVVFPGAEETGMDGMRAFLADHGDDLRRHDVLVLGLDTLGSGTPIVVGAEGALLPHAYAEEDLALVPAEVERWRIGGWTDPILARFARLRAVSLLSRGPDGGFTEYHLPTDTPDRVDFASVEACVEVAERTIAAWAG